MQILAVTVLLAVASCTSGSRTNSSSNPEKPQLQIRILNKSLPVAYSSDYAERAIGAEPGEALISLDSDDFVAMYHTSNSITIQLKPEAATALASIDKSASPTSRFGLKSRGFVIESNGKRLLAGITYEALGAAAIRAPVLLFSPSFRFVGIAPAPGIWFPTEDAAGVKGEPLSLEAATVKFTSWFDNAVK